MKSVLASKVELLSTGQVAVTPSEVNGLYEFVYRAAMSVEWVNHEGRFLAPSNYSASSVQQLSPSQWFMQLAQAMSSELGLSLATSAATSWVSVPAAVQVAIERERGPQLGTQAERPAFGGSSA